VYRERYVQEVAVRVSEDRERNNGRRLFGSKVNALIASQSAMDLFACVFLAASFAMSLLNKKAATRVEANVSLAFLYWVGRALHP